MKLRHVTYGIVLAVFIAGVLVGPDATPAPKRISPADYSQAVGPLLDDIAKVCADFDLKRQKPVFDEHGVLIDCVPRNGVKVAAP